MAEFDGGLYQVDMAYFDGGGWQSLNFQIDGLTVDQSAFYANPADFTNPPADVPLVPVEDYHPSLFIEDALDIETTDSATQGVDKIQGMGADETLDGEGGDDTIHGGYGDDYLIGGDGDDLLIGCSDAGEQRIGQLAVGNPTRPDSPEGEVNEDRQKLKGYEDQPLIGDDIMIGINIIADYVAGEDTIAVIGHTARILDITYQSIDTDGDGQNDSVASYILVYSQQGNNGGAHDEDLLGMIVAIGDLVLEEDIITNPGVTPGIVTTIDELQEAVAPTGETKISHARRRRDLRL